MRTRFGHEFSLIDPEQFPEVAEALGKKNKLCSETMDSLQTTRLKNNYLGEFSDMCKNPDFATTLNRAEFLLPTNDGMVIDMRTLALQERTIEQRFLINVAPNTSLLMKTNKIFKGLSCFLLTYFVEMNKLDNVLSI